MDKIDKIDKMDIKQLEQEIQDARAKQQRLQIERMTLSGAIGREEQWCQDRIKEMKEKTIPGLEKAAESLTAEKSHLVGQLTAMHEELDQVSAARADLKARRKEQVMHFHSDAVALKHGLAALNRDVFTLLREEGVPEAIIGEIYSRLQRSLPETSSPSKMSSTKLSSPRNASSSSSSPRSPSIK
jgi:chromosome segregation ATPase